MNIFLKALFITVCLFCSLFSYSQEKIGTVKITGTPNSAKIFLGDSILDYGGIYQFKQGIYSLRISEDSFDSYSNEFFQVYGNRLNAFNYKLKKTKEPKPLTNIEKISPLITSPLSYVLADALFPIESLDDMKEIVELQRSFMISSKEKLETNSWENDIEQNTLAYNEARDKYITSVDAYNQEVKKNNRNQIIKISMVSAVAVANTIYLIKVSNKRKKKINEVKWALLPNQFSAIIQF